MIAIKAPMPPPIAVPLSSFCNSDLTETKTHIETSIICDNLHMVILIPIHNHMLLEIYSP